MTLKKSSENQERCREYWRNSSTSQCVTRWLECQGKKSRIQKRWEETEGETHEIMKNSFSEKSELRATDFDVYLSPNIVQTML